VRAELPPTERDPDQVRRVADDVLSRSEYQWEDDTSDSPLQDLVDWINDRLANLAPSFGGGGGALPTWVGWAVLALLVAVLLFVLWRSRAGLRRDRRPARERAVVVAEAGDESVDWAAEALGHEAAGRWRDGLRCRYRALVGELSRRDVIPDLVGRTAGEFVADVRRTCPPAAPAFRRATDVFEAAWYGGAAGGPDERDRFAGLADEVLATATGPVAGAGPAERALVAPS
jgi:hypothetical protein